MKVNHISIVKSNIICHYIAHNVKYWKWYIYIKRLIYRFVVISCFEHLQNAYHSVVSVLVLKYFKVTLKCLCIFNLIFIYVIYGRTDTHTHIIYVCVMWIKKRFKRMDLNLMCYSMCVPLKCGRKFKWKFSSIRYLLLL